MLATNSVYIPIVVYWLVVVNDSCVVDRSHVIEARITLVFLDIDALVKAWSEPLINAQSNRFIVIDGTHDRSISLEFFSSVGE